MNEVVIVLCASRSRRRQRVGVTVCSCQCKHHRLCVWQRENGGVTERFGPAVRLAVICLPQSSAERSAPELLPRPLPPVWYDVAAR